jgi:hypothetical protein
MNSITVKYETMIDDTGRALFLSEGINPVLLPPMIKNVEVLCLNRIYKGVGMRNRRGGMWFYSKDFPSDGPVTIDEPGPLCFPLTKGERCKACCLFTNLFDYLSYKQLINSKSGRGLPCGCDCYVMADFRNFVNLMLDSEYYEHVYCFFPNTQLGKSMARTIITRNRSRVTSVLPFYEGYKSLHDYALNLN